MRSVAPFGHVHDDQTNEKGAATMKLTTTTNVSLDGVMQGLGGPDEDRRGGFERGGWALPLLDEEGATFVCQVYQRADAFLFGRWTYELFAGYWGVMADSGHPIAAALNTRPKYVASTMLIDPQGRTRPSSPETSQPLSAG
jgi:dihydrofolate reductase